MINIRRTMLVLAVMLPPSIALAASAHFIKGPNINTTSDGVCVSGSVAGLGNLPLDIDIAIDGTATTVCQNNGGNIAPGQGTVSGSADVSVSFFPDKNGRATFNLCASLEPDDFTLPSAHQVCPSGKTWVVLPIDEGDITITDIDVTISHDGVQLYP
jgi:hypothetical protein